MHRLVINLSTMSYLLHTYANMCVCFCLPFSSFSGAACLVTGAIWTLSEKLHPVSYSASRPIREDMRPALRKALRKDLTYEIPENYRRGAVYSDLLYF